MPVSHSLNYVFLFIFYIEILFRYALVPQPEHHEPGQGPAGGAGSRPTSPSGGPPRSPGASGGNSNNGGIFSSIFGSRQGGQSSGRRSSADQSSASNRHFPGAWGDSVD